MNQINLSKNTYLVKSFEVPIYKFNVMVYCYHVSKYKQVEKDNQHIPLPIKYDEIYATTVSNGTNSFLFFCFDDENRKINHGLIAHECFHIVNHIFEYVGDKFDYNVNQESFAYLLDYIVNQVTDIVMKKA